MILKTCGPPKQREILTAHECENGLLFCPFVAKWLQAPLLICKNNKYLHKLLVFHMSLIAASSFYIRNITFSRFVCKQHTIEYEYSILLNIEVFIDNVLHQNKYYYFISLTDLDESTSAKINRQKYSHSNVAFYSKTKLFPRLEIEMHTLTTLSM